MICILYSPHLWDLVICEQLWVGYSLDACQLVRQPLSFEQSPGMSQHEASSFNIWNNCDHYWNLEVIANYPGVVDNKIVNQLKVAESL